MACLSISWHLFSVMCVLSCCCSFHPLFLALYLSHFHDVSRPHTHPYCAYLAAEGKVVSDERERCMGPYGAVWGRLGPYGLNVLELMWQEPPVIAKLSPMLLYMCLALE